MMIPFVIDDLCILLVNILSIMVAVVLVTLVGLLMRGMYE